LKTTPSVIEIVHLIGVSLGMLCRPVEAGGKRGVSLYEQDSFEDDFVDLGTCIAMYSFDGKLKRVQHTNFLPSLYSYKRYINSFQFLFHFILMSFLSLS